MKTLRRLCSGMAILVFAGTLFLVSVVVAARPVSAAETRMLVEITVEDPSDILWLRQSGVDLLPERAVSPVQAIVTTKQLQNISVQGLATRVMVPDLDLYFQQEINPDGALGAYHTYAEMLEEMQQVAALYPDIVRLMDIGDGWEKTQGLADRDIWAMKISDNPDLEEADEPDILIMGNHHARELISVEIPLALIRVLTEYYSLDSRIHSLVNHREIWIVPMVNPDGHAYVETVDPLWRKNRNTNGSGNPYDQGVDLNRNYGFQWGYDDIGSSPDPWAPDYRGTAAFSEPETQALRDLIESHDFVLSLSYHSYGDMFLFPWGYVDEDTADHATFVGMARIYTRQNGYLYGNAKDGIIYNTNGDSDDWLYGEQLTKNKVLGVTVEVGNQFQPPSSDVPPLIAENMKPVLWMIYGAAFLPQ